jgi:starvation-inducible DNA-binding protein
MAPNIGIPNGVVDEVAERARTLGGWARGTRAEFTHHARLKEHPGTIPDATGMVADLLADHEAVTRHLRTDLAVAVDRHHDMGTSDFLTGLLERHEKMAWMLRSFLSAT